LFQSINSIDAAEQFIAENMLAFIYVTRENCSVCHGLLPQVEQVLEKYPKVQSRIINADEVPEFSGQYTVFSVPALLLFVDGKEYIRAARIVPMDQFEGKIKRIYKLVANA